LGGACLASFALSPAPFSLCLFHQKVETHCRAGRQAIHPEGPGHRGGAKDNDDAGWKRLKGEFNAVARLKNSASQLEERESIQFFGPLPFERLDGHDFLSPFLLLSPTLRADP